MLLFITRLTKEAVDDAEEAAHGADHGGHDLVAPASILTAVQSLGAHVLGGRGQLRGQQRLQSRRHGDDGVAVSKSETGESTSRGLGAGRGRGELRMGGEGKVYFQISGKHSPD